MNAPRIIFIIGISLTLGAIVFKSLNHKHSLENNAISSNNIPGYYKLDSLENAIEYPEIPSKGKYHYTVTISNTHYDCEHRHSRKEERDYAYLVNGTYEWDMDTYLPNLEAMYTYILNNVYQMQKYKVHPNSYSKELQEFDTKYDDYWDDPEDGITYPDDIFYFYLD